MRASSTTWYVVLEIHLKLNHLVFQEERSLGDLKVKIDLQFLQCNNMVGDKEQLRDISSIGLKTVINELPLTSSLVVSVCKASLNWNGNRQVPIAIVPLSYS